jgi:hypothetical protein
VFRSTHLAFILAIGPPFFDMPNRSPSSLFDSPVSSFSRVMSPARLFAPWTGRNPQPSRRWAGSPSRPLSQSQREPIHDGRRIVKRRCRVRGRRRNPSIPTPVGALRVTPPVVTTSDSWGNRGGGVGRRQPRRGPPERRELSTLAPPIATNGHTPPTDHLGAGDPPRSARRGALDSPTGRRWRDTAPGRGSAVFAAGRRVIPS